MKVTKKITVELGINDIKEAIAAHVEKRFNVMVNADNISFKLRDENIGRGSALHDMPPHYVLSGATADGEEKTIQDEDQFDRRYK